MQRQVERLIKAQATSDGGGVKLNRFIGTAFLDHLDPFMLFDEFRSDCVDDYIAGFPNHPHRGIETVTYMLAGSMLHQDHLGHEGQLDAGCVQWMSAGRGIIHSEMPQQIDGLMWGFQLWINLPRDLKMSEPHYRDIPAAQVPHLKPNPGVELRLIAGRFGSHLVSLSPSPTQLTYLDVKLDAQTDHRHPLKTNDNAFLYVFAGDILVGDKVVEKGRLALMGSGDEICLRGGARGWALPPYSRTIHQRTHRALRALCHEYQRGDHCRHPRLSRRPFLNHPRARNPVQPTTHFFQPVRHDGLYRPLSVDGGLGKW